MFMMRFNQALESKEEL
jgi:hypothetical protein